MAANAWTIHDKFLEKIHTGAVDVDTDAFVMRLYASGSNINTSTLSDASTATSELSTANGYTSGGTAITITVSESAGTVTVDGTNPQWTASGGPITARFAAIVDTTTTPDEVMASTLLDNTPADVTATDGNTFTVTINASGIYTAAQA